LLKKLITKSTGYWLHKVKTLPIGVDLFYDLTERINYRQVDLVIDAGANEGQTLRWIKHHLPAAQVISFEPVKSTFIKLQNNVARYPLCKAEHLALGAEAGEVEISLFDEYSVLNSLKPGQMNKASDARKEKIKVIRLDDYCRENKIDKIDLLKIDTEGFEKEVLEGCGDLLENGSISFVYCEVGFQSSNSRNTPLNELIIFLEKYGYLFYALYQYDAHDWQSGNHLANALFMQRNICK
jgi:FkbM family methyltransferase